MSINIELGAFECYE